MRRACVVLAACGRIGFSPEPGALGDGGAGDGDAVAVVPWTLVQVNGSTTGTVTMQPTGAGDLLVVAAQLVSTDTILDIIDNAPGGNGQYASITRATDTKGGTRDAIELYYGVAKAGVTSIAVSATTTPAAVVVWEVGGIATTLAMPVDVADQISDSTAGEPFSPPLATTAVGDFIVAAVVGQNGVTGAPSAMFVEDVATNGQGWAHVGVQGEPPSTYQVVWVDMTSGAWCSLAAAFFAATK